MVIYLIEVLKKNMENSMDCKYFYCYSCNLKNFFCDNGLKYITRSIHEKTNKPFWVFESSSKVDELLEKWRLNKS